MSKYLEELRAKLTYEPTTGKIRWMDSGKEAGHLDRTRGYIRIGFRSHLRNAARIAWFLYYGKYPGQDKEVDHINGDRADNRISNLRLVNRRENRVNSAVHREGRLPGATRAGNKWMARGTINNQRVYIGLYDTEAEAHMAYVDFVNVNCL